MTTLLQNTFRLLAPVASIMTSQLFTVAPNDTLKDVKAIFDKRRIHHIPVVRYKTIVGMISKTDLLHFIHGIQHSGNDNTNHTLHLENYLAEEIMTKGLAKLDVDDRINVAIEVFKENLFHALPVMKGDELVGIITTFDIIRMLSEEDNLRIAALKS